MMGWGDKSISQRKLKECVNPGMADRYARRVQPKKMNEYQSQVESVLNYQHSLKQSRGAFDKTISQDSLTVTKIL